MGQEPPTKVRSPDRPYPGARWRDRGTTRVAVYSLLVVWTFLVFFGMFHPGAWYVLLPGGVTWAVVVGFIISRPISNWIADTLLQLPGPERKDRHPPEHRSLTYPYSLDHVEWKPEMVPPDFYSTHSAPLNWSAFIAQVAGTLDRATPEKFKIEAHELTLVVSDGTGHAPVYLAGVLQTPPQDPIERAMHACLEALWRVQALLVVRLGTPWPAGGPRTTPGVRFEDGAILLWYGDADAPALRLDPIPFDPEPHEMDHPTDSEAGFRHGLPG